MITNNHVINEQYINKNKEIEMKINNECEKIEINNKRNI
jgi:hypothetical protein